MTPHPYGNAPVGTIGGSERAVFSGYVTSYGTPFWGIFYAFTDPDAGYTDTASYVEPYHISPEKTFLPCWTPDISPTPIESGGVTYDLACSSNGDIVIYSSQYVLANDYFDRTPGHDNMAKVLRGYQAYRSADGTTNNPDGGVVNLEKFAYYWIEPTWSPDGTDLAVTRLDLREVGLGGGDGTIGQSEIWVMVDVDSYIASPAEPHGPHMVRVSPQTITGDLTALEAADGADTFYMNPNWSRDGKVISYASATGFDFQQFSTSPNAAFNGVDFDVDMRYVGTFSGDDVDPVGGGSGENYVTWPAQLVLGGDGINEISMSWSPDGTPAQIIGVALEGSTTELLAYDLQSEAYITEQGGILFDEGVVTVVVPDSDALATGTVIRTSDEGLVDPGTDYDTMIATGSAREFWPDGWESSNPVQVIIHYDADDLAAAGITDGGPEETSLKIYWWDHVGNVWVDYGGVVDPDNNTITFFTTHFSMYKIFLELNPSADSSTVTINRPNALADGIDGVMVTAVIKDDSGTPIPNLEVNFLSDRSCDSIVYVNSRTDANGQLQAYVKSSEAGTSVVRCSNLGHVLDDTFAIAFFEPASYEGLVSGDVPGLYLYIPAGTFDTEVGYTMTMPDGSYAQLLNQAAAAATAEDRISFLDQLGGNMGVDDITGEIHAWRVSDGACMDTALQRTAFMLVDIPENVLLALAGEPVICWLDEEKAEWTPLVTTYDATTQQAKAELEHFSIYRLGLDVVDVPGLNDVVIYPNPWRADRHADNANPGVKILLPVNRNFEIRIINVAGELIDAQQVTTTGAVRSYSFLWDLNNAHGNRVASGVYFIVIKDTNSGETTVKKAAVMQ